MKKQSGFTLIELMVVMAIIAILATAGLSAYTGYIKKARDATRIADLAAINTIIQGSLSSNGMPPADMVTVVTAVNNNQMLTDPLATKSVCISSSGVEGSPCRYLYNLCDGGNGYLITALFESKSNTSSYSNIGIGTIVSGYNVGSCTRPDGAGAFGGCTGTPGTQGSCLAGLFCVTTSGGNTCSSGLLNSWCMPGTCQSGLTCTATGYYGAGTYTCA